AVICNSKMVREEIRERFAFAETAMHVIYNAVDSDVFSPRLKEHRDVVRKTLGVPDSAVVFLLVGSGYARKGVARAIAALWRLPGERRGFARVAYDDAHRCGGARDAGGARTRGRAAVDACRHDAATGAALPRSARRGARGQGSCRSKGLSTLRYNRPHSA